MDTITVTTQFDQTSRSLTASWDAIPGTKYYTVVLMRYSTEEQAYLQSSNPCYISFPAAVSRAVYSFGVSDFAQSKISGADDWKVQVLANSPDALIAKGDSDSFSVNMEKLSDPEPTFSDTGLLSWTAVQGATRYNVRLFERKGDEGDGNQIVSTSTDETALDLSSRMTEGNSYRFSVCALDDNYVYMNSETVWSEWIMHSILVINKQPENAILNEEKQATFTVSATGSNLSYQWYFNGAVIKSLPSMATFSGSKTNELTVTIVSNTGEKFYTGNKNIYTCIITNAYGKSVETEAVTIGKAHEHTWDDVITAPTCIAQGYTTHTCTKCGYSYKDTYTDATGDHTWDTGEMTEYANCIKTGLLTYTCKICGEKKTLVTAKLTTHTWNDGEVVTSATCKSAGTAKFTCTICGETKTEEIAKSTEHTWTAGVITTRATCTDTGIRTLTCFVCGATTTKEIAKDGSNHTGGTEVRNAVEATCEQDGYTGDIYCLGCGKKIKTGTIIKATAEVKLGDVDGDGEIKAADARLTLRASVNLEELTDKQEKAADVDSYAGITAADARLILRASVGLENPENWTVWKY